MSEKSFELIYTTNDGDKVKIVKKHCMKDYFVSTLWIKDKKTNKLYKMSKLIHPMKNLTYYMYNPAFNNWFTLVKSKGVNVT